MDCNLRIIDGVACPVGMPAMMGSNAGAPLAEYRHDDGSTTLFCADGSSLYALRNRRQVSFACGGRVRCVAPVPQGCVTVMIEGREGLELEWTGSEWRPAEMPALHELAPVVTAESVATLSEATDGLTLTPGYATMPQVLRADHRVKISEWVKGAYRRLAARGRAAGGWIQPVVARVRLTDSRGVTRLLTRPVVLGTPGALSLTARMELADKSCELSGSSLTATAFRIRVAWPHGAPEGVTARLEVSTELHPVDYDGVSETRCSRDGANAALVEISLPGTRLGQNPAAVAAGRVESVAGSFRVVGSTRPSAAGTLFSNVAEGAAVNEGSPEHFSAGCVAVNGDAVVWGNLTRLAEGGPTLPELTRTYKAGGCTGWVRVKMADGSSRVTTCVLPSVTPLTLSPLVSVADARAVEITVAAAGRSVTLPLRASADASAAIYVAPDLAEVELTDDPSSAILPAENPRHTPQPATAITASAADPFRPTARIGLAEGRITAVSEASRSRSSWDFGRLHFYLLTTAGIHALALSADRRRLNAALLSGMSACGAMAMRESGLICVADESLLCVSGSGVKILERGCGAVMAGYDAARGELWLADEEGNVTVREATGRTYRRTLRVTALMSSGGNLFMRDADGAVRRAGAGSEETVPSSGIEILRQEEFLHGPARVNRVEWNIFASHLSGTLSVDGDGGAGPAGMERWLTLYVNGALNSPLQSPVTAPPRRNITLTTSARVTADARLYPSKII